MPLVADSQLLSDYSLFIKSGKVKVEREINLYVVLGLFFNFKLGCFAIYSVLRGLNENSHLQSKIKLLSYQPKLIKLFSLTRKPVL